MSLFIDKVKKHTNILVKQILLSTLLFICLGAFIFTAYRCSQESSEGEVIQKEFLPKERTKRLLSTSRVRKNNLKSYKTEKEVLLPDRYKVTILNGKDTTKLYLHKEVYDTVSLGDWFYFDSSKGYYNEPYKSIK